MSRAKQIVSSIIEVHRVTAHARSALFHSVFPKWFVAALPGVVLIVFGTLLTVLNLAVEKTSWLAGLAGVVSLGAGLALLRHAAVLRARR
jgi:hypothetical protein